MKIEHNWGWPIAGYLFLGGLGGGMIIVSSLADLFFGKGDVFSMGSLLAGICIAVGSSLLIFELGRPFQFWRVFSTQRAIMTVGAWMLSILIGTSFAYFSFWPAFSPWRELIGLRHALAIFNLVLGFGVCIYTGILLGSLKARAFWNTPILPILFLVSGLSTGVAGQSLLAGVWPCQENPAGLETIHTVLGFSDVALIFLELVILFAYVLMMRLAAGADAALMAAGWLTGSKKLAFWGGLVGLGLVLPVVFYGLTIGHNLAQVLVLTGGLILRFLVVYSDERATLPGEATYYARLPESDVPFMKAWDYK